MENKCAPSAIDVPPFSMRRAKRVCTEAEGIRESQIKRCWVSAVAILEADGEAQARIRVAEAERNAIQLVQEGFSATGTNPAQYLVAVRYLESLGDFRRTIRSVCTIRGHRVVGSLGGMEDLLNGVTKG